jgi:hypothetical protein
VTVSSPASLKRRERFNFRRCSVFRCYWHYHHRLPLIDMGVLATGVRGLRWRQHDGRKVVKGVKQCGTQILNDKWLAATSCVSSSVQFVAAAYA